MDGEGERSQPGTLFPAKLETGPDRGSRVVGLSLSFYHDTPTSSLVAQRLCVRGARWRCLARLSLEEVKFGPGFHSQTVGYPLPVFMSFGAFRLSHSTG